MNKLILIFILFPFFSFCQNIQKGYDKSVELNYLMQLKHGNFSNKSFFISTTHGYRLNLHNYLGAGIGVGYKSFLSGVENDRKLNETNYYINSAFIPIYVQYKYSLSKEQFTPFTLINLGYSFNTNKFLSYQNNFFSEISIGLDFYFSKTKGFKRKDNNKYKRAGFFIATGFYFSPYSYAHYSPYDDREVLQRFNIGMTFKGGIKF